MFKKNILIFFIITIISGYSFSRSNLLLLKKKKYNKNIIGEWHGKTWMFFPVEFNAKFKNDYSFKLNVKVLGLNYDTVRGNFHIDSKRNEIILIGLRKRNNKFKELVFKIKKFTNNQITLQLILDDGDIEKNKKPVTFNKRFKISTNN